VAVDSTNLYWANPNRGTVIQANLDGSNPYALFANQDAPHGVAVGPWRAAFGGGHGPAARHGS
jgi:hypothetical protein